MSPKHILILVFICLPTTFFIHPKLNMTPENICRIESTIKIFCMVANVKNYHTESKYPLGNTYNFKQKFKNNSVGR